ncbi:MAG: hypothetical protein ACXVA9_04605, partial [Bdellovibrionales bacterium]
PDGWPYLFARTGPEGTEPIPQVVQWLAARGIGLVINAHKMLPDYIFPYGMIWNYVETGRFLQPETEKPRTGEAVCQEGRKLIMGAPTDKYLPPYVREVLRHFLSALGFTHPRILVISTPDFKEVDLMFSTESLDNLPKAQHRILADRLAWFLPLHYTLVLGSEEGFPPFGPL